MKVVYFDPYDIVPSLHEIERGGVLTPTMIIRAAKNQENPLHKFFDWSKNKSEIKETARRLIRSVRFELAIDTLRKEGSI